MKTAATIDTSEMNEQAAALAEAAAPQPAPKPITAKELKNAADAHVALGRSIVELEELRIKSDADLASRCGMCDLDDKAALNEIARLQVLIAILPKRIEARENDFLASGNAVGEKIGNFIAFTLGPRCRALRTKAAGEVRAALRKLVSDEFLLNRAVNQSDAVEAIDGIYNTWRGTFVPHEVAPEAYKILGSFETLLAYEKILASAIKQAGRIEYSEFFVEHMKKQSAGLAAIREGWQKNADEAVPKDPRAELSKQLVEEHEAIINALSVQWENTKKPTAKPQNT